VETKISKFNYGILDVDGTLVDNRKLYRWLLAKILPLGFSVNGTDLYLPTGGLPLPSWAKFLQPIPGLTRFVLVAERGILKLADLLDLSRPKLFEGTEEVLSQLSQKGIKLFATSGSKTQKATRRLEKAGILSFFTAMAGSEMPKREHIPYFASQVDLPLQDFAKQAFLISDGPVDLHLAVRYGVYPVGVAQTLEPSLLLKQGAEEIVSNLGELLQ